MEAALEAARLEAARRASTPSRIDSTSLAMPSHWTEPMPAIEALFRMAENDEVWNSFEPLLINFIKPEKRQIVSDLGLELTSINDELLNGKFAPKSSSQIQNERQDP